MADSSVRAGRLVGLLGQRHPDRAADLDPRGIRAGTPTDPVGQVYGAADEDDYRCALRDLGIHADPGVYGLAARYPTDSPDALDDALAGAVADYLARDYLEDL
ncbi:hypothetical protein [Parafrankia sp. FMc2]|uniref:hypothetical protein n=1 Tax=Parafrankia sp. FMc2 TaxID=3233196 RepID=UPI0034D6C684